MCSIRVEGSEVPVVLQVLPSLATGGAERAAVDIARAVAEAGAVSLVASAGGPLEADLRRAGARHVTLPLASGGFLALRRNARRLARLIAAEGVDIVHARSPGPSWSAYRAAQMLGAHFLTTFHEVYALRRPRQRRYSAVMVQGERVIAVSQFLADHIRANYPVDPGRIRLIRRGIDLRHFDPDNVGPERLVQLARRWNLPDGVPIVMLAGRLTGWKGQRLLLDALTRLKGSHRFRCLLVGSDKGRIGYRAELERQARRLGLEERVQLTGECADMPAAYMLADVVVSASTEPETFGRVITEAQAMGRPVVTTNHGGADEQVVPARTAWMVQPGDAASLAAAMAEALSLSPEERQALGRTATAHVRENFTRERMCAQTLAVYEELLRADAYAQTPAVA
jgi:glycosyltransferase involved in cell wall biosynthesis